MALLLLLAGLTFAAPSARARPAPQCESSVTISDRGDDGGANQLRGRLERACDGATFRLTPGTFTLRNGPLVVTRAVTIIGLGPPARPTTIDAAGTGGALIVHAPLAMRNVTVTGGASAQGGALTILNSDVDLTDVVLTGNTSTGNGGALFVHAFDGESHTTTVRSSTIADNTAALAGGGLLSWATTGATSTVVVDGVVVARNSAPSGGGLVNSATEGGSGRMTVTGSTVVEDNTAASDLMTNGGGGIANVAFGNASVAMDVLGTTVLRGNAGAAGGGIYTAGQYGASATLHVGEQASVVDNVAELGGGVANIAVLGGTTVASIADDVVVRGNTAHGVGGGIGSAVHTFGVATLFVRANAAVTDNVAGLGAGGIYTHPLASTTIEPGAVVSGNTPA